MSLIHVANKDIIFKAFPDFDEQLVVKILVAFTRGQDQFGAQCLRRKSISKSYAFWAAAKGPWSIKGKMIYIISFLIILRPYAARQPKTKRNMQLLENG